MRIWIVNHYLSLQPQRGTLRHLVLADELKRRGHRVTLFGCARHHFHAEEDRMGLRLWRERSHHGHALVWINSIPYASNSGRRYANMGLFSANFLAASLLRGGGRPDLVLGSSGHLPAAYAAMLAARWRGVPFVYEIRDLWPLTLTAMGKLRAGGTIARILEAMNRRLLKRAALVVGTISGIRDYAGGYGIEDGRVEWITNGVMLDEFPPLPAPPPSKEALDIVYFGSMGEPNAVDVIVEAALRASRMSPDRPIRVTLIGEGSERTRLERMAQEAPPGAVRFLPPVPRRELPALVGNADAFVVVLRRCDPVYRYGISLNKLAEYMALGRPVVLGGDVPDNPVARADCGLTAGFEEPESLASAFVELARTDRSELARMGRNARAAAEAHFDYAKLAGRYADLLQGLAGT
ncbi:MAG TPA: glycosyltransferase WbuB [Syntrophus sp. (in: bacteria)]|nr:glycosyltransferase WbuB [Syntrophus sp. (in: bacteria)]